MIRSCLVWSIIDGFCKMNISTCEPIIARIEFLSTVTCSDAHLLMKVITTYYYIRIYQVWVKFGITFNTNLNDWSIMFRMSIIMHITNNRMRIFLSSTPWIDIGYFMSLSTRHSSAM